jgi:hypothetical protein
MENASLATPVDCIVMQLPLYQCSLVMESKTGKFVKLADVDRLLREHAVMRRRLLDIASGEVLQPVIHAGAAFKEIDEIQAIAGYVCQTCGIGYRLPSGRCDHCNRPFMGFQS